MSASKRAAAFLGVASVLCLLHVALQLRYTTLRGVGLVSVGLWVAAAIGFAVRTWWGRTSGLEPRHRQGILRLAVVPWFAWLPSALSLISVFAEVAAFVGGAGDDQASRATLLAKVLSEVVWLVAMFLAPIPVTLLAWAASRQLEPPPVDAPAPL
ncbi:MAG: hypothetical protein AAGH15_01940 [Myxococcota bacterium]